MRKVEITFTAHEPWERDFRPLTKLGIDYLRLPLDQLVHIVLTADPEIEEKDSTVVVNFIFL